MKIAEKLMELINLNNEMIQLNRNKIEKLVECVELQQEEINSLTELVCKKPEFKNADKKVTITKEEFLDLAASVTADFIEDGDDIEFAAHIPVVSSLLATEIFDKKEEKDEQKS